MNSWKSRPSRFACAKKCSTRRSAPSAGRKFAPARKPPTRPAKSAGQSSDDSGQSSDDSGQSSDDSGLSSDDSGHSEDGSDQSEETIASASISTSISGEIHRLTSTTAVTGRIVPEI